MHIKMVLTLFLRFAMNNASLNGKILYPCVKCGNRVIRTEMEVQEHLIVYGFIKGYSHWIVHGELSFSSSSRTNLGSYLKDVNSQIDDMDGLLHDAFGIPMHIEGVETSPGVECSNSDDEKFYKLINDSQQELYPGVRTPLNYHFLFDCYILSMRGSGLTNTLIAS
jgi:hypothetical protein